MDNDISNMMININDIITSDINKMKLKNTLTDYELDYYRSEFYDSKEENRFIKNVEAIVRRSIEYHEFISYIRNTLGYKYCVFTDETYEETEDIEIHHHPFTLYDIAKIITFNKIEKDEKFTTLIIAEEVIANHYKMNVGIVPLLGSLHKKYHNGFLDIPIEVIIGNYVNLYNIYKIPEDIHASVKAKCKITLSNATNKTWYAGLDRFIKEIKIAS